MDESPETQSPADLLVILSEIAFLEIPADTVAIKFSGRFNKGVDYVGDVAGSCRVPFRRCGDPVRPINEFGMKPNLKISVHTGSDKFSLYPGIRPDRPRPECWPAPEDRRPGWRS